MARKGSGTTATKSLSHKEQVFCYKYVENGFNGTKAAIETGWAARTATVTASQLLTRPNVQAEVIRLKAKLLTGAEASAQSIVDELALLGLKVAITDVISWNESGITFLANSEDIPREVARCIESIEVTEDYIAGKDGKEGRVVLKTKVRMHSKTAALGILAKHFGILKDVIEHQHKHEHVHKYDLKGLSRQELEALQGILHKASDNKQPEPAHAGTFGAN